MRQASCHNSCWMCVLVCHSCLALNHSMWSWLLSSYCLSVCPSTSPVSITLEARLFAVGLSNIAFTALVDLIPVFFRIHCPGLIQWLFFPWQMKWNESGFRPPLCTYRLNWARRTSWGWWDEWDDTVLHTQDSTFEPWRSEAEHATSRSRRLPTILSFTRGWGRNIFVSFKLPRLGTEPRTLALKAAVLTTTLGPPSFSHDTNRTWLKRKVFIINKPSICAFRKELPVYHTFRLDYF